MDCAVPAAAEQDVVIEGIPLKAENSVLVRSQMPAFQVVGFSLVKLSHQHSAQLSSEGVVTASGTDFASLQHFVVLNCEKDTFFWKRSWREVACQYSRVPSECVAMNALRKFYLLGLLAKPVTGELSDPIRTYCTFS